MENLFAIKLLHVLQVKVIAGGQAGDKRFSFIRVADVVNTATFFFISCKCFPVIRKEKRLCFVCPFSISHPS